MRTVHAAAFIGALALLATAGVGVAPVGASTAPDAVAAKTVPAPDTGTSTLTLENETTPDNFSVTIRTPQTVVANASLNYSIDTVGANGTVNATWSFDGENKTGTRVTHAFEESGNATIEVTVTDESGATVTRSLTVDVVEFGDKSDNRGTGKNLATFGLWVGMFFVLVFGFILVLVPKGMQVITDALSR